eukprot:gene16874-20046_t
MEGVWEGTWQARRQVWMAVKSFLKGRAVMLTTHLMEECEALCDRVAILVRGRIACLGTVQRLKSRYSCGYQVELKLESSAIETPGRVEYIMQHLGGPEAEVLEKRGACLKYSLASSPVALSALFRSIEERREEL